MRSTATTRSAPDQAQVRFQDPADAQGLDATAPPVVGAPSERAAAESASPTSGEDLPRGPRGPVEGAESALVARLKAGEEAAFEELIRTHGPRMLALARRFLPTEADAEDAFQDALLSVFRSIGSFAAESRLGTWLHRIVVNAALMRLRWRGRRPETPMDDGTLDGVSEVGSRADSRTPGPDALAAREARETVRSCLERLPEDYRLVVRLRDIEQLDLATIGRLLDLPASTIRSRLRRGRSAVRVAIETHFRTVTR